MRVKRKEFLLKAYIQYTHFQEKADPKEVHYIIVKKQKAGQSKSNGQEGRKDKSSIRGLLTKLNVLVFHIIWVCGVHALVQQTIHSSTSYSIIIQSSSITRMENKHGRH